MRTITIRPTASLYTIMTELQVTSHYKHSETLRLTKPDMHRIRDGKKQARTNGDPDFTVTLSNGDQWLIVFKARGRIQNYRQPASEYKPITL